MTTFLICGASRVSIPLIEELTGSSNGHQFTVIDQDHVRLQSLTASLSKSRQHLRVQTVPMVAPHSKDLQKHFEKADVCINVLPQNTRESLSRLALQTNTSYIDHGIETSTIRSQLREASESPNSAHISLVPGCSVMPGLGSVLSSYGLIKKPDASSIRIRTGRFAVEGESELHSFFLEDKNELIGQFQGCTQTLEDDKIWTRDVFSGLERVHFSGFPLFEAYYCSNSAGTCPWSFQGRLRNFDVKVLRPRGHHERFRFLSLLGFFGPESIVVDTHQVLPSQCLQALITARSQKSSRDRVILRVQLSSSNATPDLQLDIIQEAPTPERSAYDHLRSVTLSIAAQAVTQGHARLGALGPESAFDSAWFVEQLRARGVIIQESVPLAVPGGFVRQGYDAHSDTISSANPSSL